MRTHRMGWLAAVALTACGVDYGGSSLHEDYLEPVSSQEVRLSGTYDLVGFEVEEDGVWKSDTDFPSFSGSMRLTLSAVTAFSDAPEPMIFYRTVYHGTSLVDWEPFGTQHWDASADEMKVYTRLDGTYDEGDYTFDGTTLIWDHTNDENGRRSIEEWRKVP